MNFDPNLWLLNLDGIIYRMNNLNVTSSLRLHLNYSLLISEAFYVGLRLTVKKLRLYQRFMKDWEIIETFSNINCRIGTSSAQRRIHVTPSPWTRPGSSHDDLSFLCMQTRTYTPRVFVDVRAGIPAKIVVVIWLYRFDDVSSQLPSYNACTWM
jgi:hypothetical protein